MPKIPKKQEKLSIKIDQNDRKITNLLNKNARLTLRELAKETKLSIDSVKRRIDKLTQARAIQFTVLPNPGTFGYSLGAHVYLKLQNLTDEKLNHLRQYLKMNPRVIVLMSMIGDYDLYFALMSKNTRDLNEFKETTRKKFSDLISDWKEVIVAEIFKYEEYEFIN